MTIKKKVKVRLTSWFLEIKTFNFNLSIKLVTYLKAQFKELELKNNYRYKKEKEVYKK